MRTIAVAAVALCALLLQDPEKRPASPPPDAAPLPTFDEPRVRPALRDDLYQQFSTPDALQGTYALIGRTERGREDLRPGKGWLHIGRRHMMLHLQAGGVSAGMPMLRSGVWEWRREQDRIRLETLSGHFNDADGEIKLEQPGQVAMRRVDVIGGTVRIWQDDSSWLEFVRIE